MLYDANFKFEISVSQVGYSDKPTGREYKDMYFDKMNLDPQGLLDKISSGHSICYLHDSAYPLSTKRKLKTNYLGTQVFFFDFDHYSVDAVPFIDSLKNKPTCAYYTFSHQENDIRFRLIYVIDELVYGEQNFNKVYHAISSTNNFGSVDFRVDNQLYNGTTPDAIIMCSSIVYSLSDFDVVLEHNESPVFTRSSTSDIEYDFFHLSTTDFLNAHSDLSLVHYQSQSSTMIDTGCGYYLYPEQYYAITRTWDIVKDSRTGKDRRVQHRVPVGERKKNLFARGMVFKTNYPEITYNELLYCLSFEVYHYFDNKDNKLDKKVISDIAKGVIKSTSTIKESKKDKFRIDKEYWNEQGISIASARGYIRKIINKEEFYKHYDSNLSVSDNIKNFKNENYTISPATVYRYLEEDNILKGQFSQYKEYITSPYIITGNEKYDPLKEAIINLIRDNDKITIKEMVRNLNSSEKTIKRRISELKNDDRLDRIGGKKNGRWVIKN